MICIVQILICRLDIQAQIDGSTQQEAYVDSGGGAIWPAILRQARIAAAFPHRPNALSLR
jgi:hypothetical protein